MFCLLDTFKAIVIFIPYSQVIGKILGEFPAKCILKEKNFLTNIHMKR